MKKHGGGGRQERAKREGVADPKAHIHGAACGHVAVLHENHVDFLVEGGQLECYGGKEVSLVPVAGKVLFCFAHDECCCRWSIQLFLQSIRFYQPDTALCRKAT